MIAGLVLAAGAGSRFDGPGPKLLALLNGRPLVEHAIAAACAAPELERVVVVVGADPLDGVDFARAEKVVCGDWSSGQSASLRCGVKALREAERILVTLGDEPLVSPAAIALMAEQPGGARATYNGRPGHPVVLGREQIEAISSLTGDHGARELLAGGLLVECSDLGSGMDVDTTADLEAIRHEARAGV